jgi:hypothetical protein
MLNRTRGEAVKPREPSPSYSFPFRDTTKLTAARTPLASSPLSKPSPLAAFLPVVRPVTISEDLHRQPQPAKPL